MNITVEKGAACTASLNVEVPADKVAEQKKEIISTYAKNVNLKGFRPGKAPASIIEKRFGGDITNELNNKLINLGCQEAIKQEDLEVLSVNVADEPTLADDGALSFKAELILSPVFDLPKYKGIELEGRAIEVTDKDVSDALEGLQQRFAEYNEVERAAEDGDIVVIDFKTSLDGKPVKEVVGKDVGFLEGREGHWARVEEEGFLPGLGMGLKGLKSGEKKEVTVTMPDEFPISEVCGTDIVFDVEVKEIKEQQLPELNEEFVGKFVPDKSMDEFKELLTDQLKAEKEKEVNDELVQQVVKHLDETTEVVLPEALLEQEIQGTKYRMIENAKQQGMTENSHLRLTSFLRQLLRKRRLRSLMMKYLQECIS